MISWRVSYMLVYVLNLQNLKINVTETELELTHTVYDVFVKIFKSLFSLKSYTSNVAL